MHIKPKKGSGGIIKKIDSINETTPIMTKALGPLDSSRIFLVISYFDFFKIIISIICD